MQNWVLQSQRRGRLCWLFLAPTPAPHPSSALMPGWSEASRQHHMPGAAPAGASPLCRTSLKPLCTSTTTEASPNGRSGWFRCQMRAMGMAMVETSSLGWLLLLQRCSPSSLPASPVNHSLTPAPDAAALKPQLLGADSPALWRRAAPAPQPEWELRHLHGPCQALAPASTAKASHPCCCQT